jgi:hypothetical protein
MKKMLQIIFLSAMFFLTVGVNMSNGLPSILYGPVTNPANGHQYYVLNPSTWDDAEAAAVALGGHLATVNNPDENNYIMNNFSVYGDLWIGYTDRSFEGTFEWVSGEPVTYANWYSGEPNNAGSENYTEFYTSGGWNDLNGGNSLYGVVEVGTQGVPTLSEWGLIFLGLLLLGAGTLYIYRRRRVSFQL